METERIEIEIPETQTPETETKKVFYRTPLFWSLIAGGVFLLATVVIVIVILCTPGRQSDTDQPTQPETTAPTTEPTLPPPEANPIGLGDFAMEDGYLYCITAPSVRGIDVSEWQGEIDWQQVKSSGVEFAMIRAGWRGSEQGVLAEDTYAQTNYAGAAAAGIKVGAYFFSQAISVAEAVEEANYLLEIIQDWELDMPVVYDWEYISADSRTGKTDARTLTDCTKAFCDTVAGAGYEPMVYFNTDHSYNNVFIRELTDYPFWLARYDTVLDYPYKVDMWQYTETGSVPGISTNVDINLYFPWEQ